MKSTTITSGNSISLLILLLIHSVIQCCQADGNEENQNENNNNNSAADDINREDDLEWVQAFSNLRPYLIVVFLVVFTMHALFYPQYATRQLMKSYVENDIRASGQVLSCETKPPAAGVLTKMCGFVPLGGRRESEEKDGEFSHGSVDDEDAVYLVEIIYEATEHRYADNPSLKYRNPNAIDSKRFLRRFEYLREMKRGDPVEVLLANHNWPRTGCPREIVEQYLNGYGEYKYTNIFLFLGVMLVMVILGFAIREISRMEDSHSGWIALMIGLCGIEIISFFYSADKFLKKKRNVFDSARVFVSSTEQAEARRERAIERAKASLEPSWVGFHNFAGHARADQDFH